MIRSSPRRISFSQEDFMRTLVVMAATLVTASIAGAQSADVPLHNWTVPAYTQSSRGGITTMSDVTSPRVFVGIQPCRVADTRGNGAPIQGGIFANSQQRTWDVTGICGIPGGADAISVNFSVVSPAGTPLGAFLLAWPTGQPAPPTAIMTYGPGATVISNAAIVPLGAGEQLNVNVSHSTHVIMDVNGYFSATLDSPENFLSISNNSSAYSLATTNGSTTCVGPCGIRGNIFSTAGGYAVSGYAIASTGANIGVYGESDSTGGAIGVKGIATAATATPTYGVMGETHSSGTNSAGVYGFSTQVGSSGGYFFNTAAGNTYVSLQDAGISYSIFSFTRLRAASLDITGTKNFVSPHPENPGLEIRYASVEAPSVDVYFRGTASLVNGSARIEVPDHFRFTAREGTYMTTLTPLDSATPLRVAQEGPDGVVVQGAGNTRFHYVVYAERAEIVGYEPVTRNTSFTPGLIERGGGPERLPEATRALLVKNGTLNADGTYNLETARAQGWTIPEPAPRPVLQTP
jgi:hypothetical protein